MSDKDEYEYKRTILSKEELILWVKVFDPKRINEILLKPGERIIKIKGQDVIVGKDEKGRFKIIDWIGRGKGR